MRGATLGIMCVQFSKNDELVMAGANDNATRIWTVDTGRLKVAACPPERVCGCGQSPRQNYA